MRLHYHWPFSGTSGSREDGSAGLEPGLVIVYLLFLNTYVHYSHGMYVSLFGTEGTEPRIIWMKQMNHSIHLDI
jgi:hypothetical protein